MQFLYIKTKENIENLIPILFEVLNESLEIDYYFNDQNSLTIIYSYANLEIKNTLTSLSIDLYLDILVYESLIYNDKESLDKNYKLFLKINEVYKLKYQYYNNNLILSENYLNVTKDLKSLILSNYYLDKEMKRTIVGFLENDQNISKASKNLYLHRNTLSLRLSKFEEVTNFDIKKFIDGFLIYHLVK